MKRIKWNYQFPEEVRRLVTVLAANDIEVTEPEAALLWQCYSNTMSAQWMIVTEGDSDGVMRGLMDAMNPMPEDTAWPAGVEDVQCCSINDRDGLHEMRRIDGQWTCSRCGWEYHADDAT